jgi:hypothetical protein
MLLRSVDGEPAILKSARGPADRSNMSVSGVPPTSHTGGTAAAATPSASTASTSASFAGELARVLRPHGEKLAPVSGHAYSEIVSGADRGMMLNEAHGNPRFGEAFEVVHRNGRVLHVYGSGADRQVVIVGLHSAPHPTGGGAPRAA